MRYFIGPMSKNVVDAVLEHDSEFVFIPSRRQIDYDCGYVNNWSTEEFSRYVGGRALIQRDHGGPSQGSKNDDGIDSFLEDAKFFNSIHIDPWKAHTDIESGIESTINSINLVYSINDKVKFEVGTEESIRSFSTSETLHLMSQLEKKLKANVFDNIEYVVVQSGVGLDLRSQKNTGKFNCDRLESMISISKKFGKKSKEHNGDFLTSDEYISRFEAGLDSINIAPEFGQIETQCYLAEISPDIEEYYQICYNSGRWKKWVSQEFDPKKNKEDLIKICGHYIISNPEFAKIKPDIDEKIKQRIKEKLTMLSSLT